MYRILFCKMCDTACRRISYIKYGSHKDVIFCTVFYFCKMCDTACRHISYIRYGSPMDVIVCTVFYFCKMCDTACRHISSIKYGCHMDAIVCTVFYFARCVIPHVGTSRTLNMAATRTSCFVPYFNLQDV